jgi:hypothetical protein
MGWEEIRISRLYRTGRSSGTASNDQAVPDPSKILADAQPAVGECRSERVPSVVDRRIEGSAGAAESIRQDVDRHVVEGHGDNLALVRDEVALDRFLQGGEELGRFEIPLGTRTGVGDQSPAVRRNWDLAFLPGAAADLRRHLHEGELVDPRRETTFATKVPELAQDGDESVIRALRNRRAAAVELEPRGLEEQGVQRIDRWSALGAVRAEPIDPGLRLGIEARGRLTTDLEPGTRARLID